MTGKHRAPGPPDRKPSKGGGKHERPGTNTVEEVLREDSAGRGQAVRPDALARIWAKISGRQHNGHEG